MNHAQTIIYCLIIPGWLAALEAQTKSDPLPEQGLSDPAGAYLLSNIETINRTSGNLSLTIPLAKLGPNRAGFSPSLPLVYNSKFWSPDIVTVNLSNHTHYANGVVNLQESANGWSYELGYSLESRARPSLESGSLCGYPLTAGCPDIYYYYKYRIVFPDGSRHLLRLQGYSDQSGDGYYPYNSGGGINCTYFANDVQCNANTRNRGTFVYYTTDGTFARLEVPQLNSSGQFYNSSEPPWTLYLKDGTTVQGGTDAQGNYRPQVICDRNNNCLTVDNVLGGATTSSLTDDFGRTITLTYGASNTDPTAPFSDIVQAPGYNGESMTWTIKWAYQNSSVQTYTSNVIDSQSDGAFGFSGLETAGLSLISEIDLPSQTTAGHYSFAYGATWGEVSSVTLPSGVTAAYSYSLNNSGAGCTGSVHTPGAEEVLQDYPCKKVVTYNDEFNPGQTVTETSTLNFPVTLSAPVYGSSSFTGPDGGTIKTLFYPGDFYGPGTWNSGLTYEVDFSDGSKNYSIWAQNPLLLQTHLSTTLFPYERNNPYLLNSLRYVPEGAAGFDILTVHHIDRNGNELTTSEYDWAASTNFTVTSPVGSQAQSLTWTILPPLIRTTTNTYTNPTSDAIVVPATNETNVYWNAGIPHVLTLTASTQVTDSDGATVLSRDEFCRDANGNVLYRGQLRDTYAAGTPLVTCSTGAAGSNAVVSSYTYVSGAPGVVSTATDRRLVQTTFVYDTNNLYRVSMTQATGKPEARNWTYATDTTTGKTTTVHDQDNSPTGTATDVTMGYDVFGRPTTITDPAKIVSITYNDGSRYKVTKTTLSPTQNVNMVEWFDQLGRISLVQNSDTTLLVPPDRTGGIQVKHVYTYGTDGSYEFASTPFRSTPLTGDPAGGWQMRKLDQLGRLVETGNFSVSSYPGISTPDSKVTIAYDGRNQTVMDEAANSATTSNPGATRIMHLDGVGRLAKVDDATGVGGATATTTYGYDGADHLKSVAQGLQTRGFTYDGLGRLTTASSPELGIPQGENGAASDVNGLITYTYDDESNLISRVDPLNVACYGIITNGSCTTGKGYSTTDGYDGLDRPRLKTYSGSLTPEVSYTYDTNVSIANHAESNYYKGRLSQVNNSASSTSYRYDAAGRVQSSSQTVAGKPYVFGYSYNGLGLESMIYPSGRQVSNHYDAGGRVDQIVNGPLANHLDFYANSIQYAPHGGVESMVVGPATTLMTQTAGFNSRLQPSGVKLAGSQGQVIWNLTNTYGSLANNNGNTQTQVVDATGAGGLGFTTTYTYDSANRISTVTEGSSGGASVGWSRNYGYDIYGNQYASTNVGIVESGQTPATASWFTPKNRLMMSLFDHNGNQSSMGSNYTFRYDAENHLFDSTIQSAGATTTYTYDGLQRRVVKADGTLTTYFIYDAFGNLAAEYENYIGSPSPCGKCYLIADPLGSTRLMLGAPDASGKELYDYVPMGEQIPVGTNSRGAVYGPTATPEQTTKFTGKERDAETGLDYFDARYFSGAQGRFTSADPSNLSVDFSVPQSWNRYSYALNNPLAYVDRNGLWPTWIHNQIINEAFPGLSAQQLQTLRTASHDTDYSNRVMGNSPQEPAVSFIHSMSNGTDPDEAHALGLSMQLADRFVQDNEASARVAQANWLASGHTGVSPNALTAFGNALHTVTDATSPAHAGFQRWSGALLPAIGHVAREFRISLGGSERENAIQSARSAYLNTFGWDLFYQATGEQPLKPKVTSKIKFGDAVDNPDQDE